jgi:hypothetical protein
LRTRLAGAALETGEGVLQTLLKVLLNAVKSELTERIRLKVWLIQRRFEVAILQGKQAAGQAAISFQTPDLFMYTKP